MAAPNIETIVSLAKRRGFVFPASEIYGGLGSSWDYGSLGVELANNIKQSWWRWLVYERDDIEGLDSSIIQNRQVETTKRPCPYDIYLSGPDRVIEGDLITFASNNRVTTGAIPVLYNWTVSSNANITSGLGTPAITVDTAGMGGQTITADLDVNDGVYDATCRQRISVPTIVDRKPELPKNYKFDEFDSLAFDDDKARLDAFAIELQNNPDAQGYIILYQGTDKVSKRTRNADKIGKRTLDYLVKVRGVDPRRIVITNWGTRPKTRYELWVIPPGAPPPVPQ
jgi:hypothetical protein